MSNFSANLQFMSLTQTEWQNMIISVAKSVLEKPKQSPHYWERFFFLKTFTWDVIKLILKLF